MIKIPGQKRGKPKRPAPMTTADGLWDRPQAINMIADILLLFSSIAIGYIILVSIVRLPFFPLRQIVVTHTLEQITPMQIEYAGQKALRGNFFTVDLEKIQDTFEKLPWVRKISVHRHWPDRIELTIEEHVAVAYWQNNEGETRFVNHHGEIFSAAQPSHLSSLPVFTGPEDSAGLMVNRYRDFGVELAMIERSIQELTLSPRQAWQLRLSDGLLLEIGRDQVNSPLQDRLRRFVSTYGSAKNRLQTPIASIDMRYPNGFALRPTPQNATKTIRTTAALNVSKGRST